MGQYEGRVDYTKRDRTLADALREAEAGNVRRAEAKVLLACNYGYVPSDHPTLVKIRMAVDKSRAKGWRP